MVRENVIQLQKTKLIEIVTCTYSKCYGGWGEIGVFPWYYVQTKTLQ